MENEAEKRKLAEEALEFERTQLLSIFDSIDDGVYVAEMDTYEILYVSPSAKDAFQKELIGGICYRVLQGVDSPCEFCTNEIILKKYPEPHRWEHHNPILDRDYAFVDRIIKWPDGRNVRLEIAIDISERNRTQEMMIQTEKIMFLGGYAAGMAHEINNSLAGIIQNVQVLKNRMSNNLLKNEQAAEECGTTIDSIEAYMDRRGMFSMIDMIMESEKRAAKIVYDMLSFSRKSSAHFATRDLGKLLNKTVELSENNYDLKKEFDFRQIKIIREYAAAMPEVMCEENTLQQVFMNILENGARAMTEDRGQKADAGGQIAEDISREKPQFILRVMQEDGMARIEIEDNGPGMDEETRKHVFEPFFTTKGVGIGTGLGLSVSHFIITENHGGTITVDSTPGKGSKFIIQLPFERAIQ